MDKTGRNHYQYDVSIIILTYKPCIEKLRSTLVSAVLQEKISKQIIICDDGSDYNYFSEIKQIMAEYGFSDYKLIASSENQGTCKNFFSGLKEAEGKYSKGISPGDYFYAADTLYRWYEFMENNQIDSSFGDAIYYRNSETEEGIIPYSQVTNPFFRQLFSIKKRGKNLFLKKTDYLIFRDFALGASFLAKTEIQIQYCRILIDKVVYAEDNIFGLMLWDDSEFFYYPQNVIVYEVGTGISTIKSEAWANKLNNDNKWLYRIIIESNHTDAFSRRLRQMDLVSADWRNNPAVKTIFFPLYGVLYFIYRFKRKMGQGTSNLKIDANYMEKIGIRVL